MSSLDAELRPLSRLHDAGLGFLVEYVRFLQEPLDALRGDSVAVSAEGTFWRYSVADVTRLVEQLSVSLTALDDDHAGASATGFGDVADRVEATLYELRRVVAGLNERVGTVTDLVAQTRGMLDDWVEGWVDDTITEFTAARAASPITQGGSVATTIASTLSDAAELGHKMGRAVTELLDRLDDQATAIRDEVAAFADSAQRLRSPVPGESRVPAAEPPSVLQEQNRPSAHGLPTDPDALFAMGRGTED